MAAAITLVPALCGLAGRRLLPRRVRRRTADGPTTRAAGAADRPLGRPRRPPPAALGAGRADRAARAGRPGAGDAHLAAGRQQPARRTSPPAQAYDLVADEFGPGANGPLMLVVDLRRRSPDRELDGARPAPAARRVDGVAAGAPAGALARRRGRASSPREPAFGPTDERTGDLRRRRARRRARRRSRSPARRRCSPTSPTCWPSGSGWSSASSSAVSVLLLMVVFRSVVVPLKAAVMNLLSIGAAYGVLTAVVPVGLGRRPARARPRDAGVELGADPDVRDPVRPVDGLRGVPALADPRGLAGHRRRARQRGARPGRHRPGDLGRRRDHGRRLPRLRHRGRRRRQACSGFGMARRDRRSTPPSSGWSSCPRRWRCSAAGTGGCPAGSTGCCPPSTPRAPRTRPTSVRRRGRARRRPHRPRPDDARTPAGV